MNVQTKFNIEQILYLKLDPEQKERMVTRIQLNPGSVMYCTTDGLTENWAYEFELSPNKDTLKSLSC